MDTDKPCCHGFVVEPIQVLCVDDSADVLEALSFLIRRTADLRCVGTLPTASNLVEEVRRSGADVVLLDLGIPGSDPLEEIRDIKEAGIAAKTIVFSGDCEFERAMDAGADACVRKGTDPDKLIDTIRRVVGGAAA